MAQPIDSLRVNNNIETAPPTLDGDYSRVAILSERITHFRNKFGHLALHKLNVEIVREYEDQEPRTTWYDTLAAYRIDDDTPDQSRYPLVGYSNALLTTPRIPNTATNRFFLNPAYEGFAAVNVGVKRQPADVRHNRLVPHSISLTEIADDELVVTDHIAEALGLGQGPDENNIRHIDKSAYSRGVEISLVQAARAGLQNMAIDRLHGRGPGPIKKVGFFAIGKSLILRVPDELKAVTGQVRREPRHAFHNYFNVVTHRVDELMSYFGDAMPLLEGEVEAVMPYVNPQLRGYIATYENDAFGRYKDFVAHSDEVPNLQLIQNKGAHLSGMDESQVHMDRDEWRDERKALDAQYRSTPPLAS